MDIGASSYHRFLDGDDEGFVEIIKEYNNGLILFLNTYVKNIFIAEELAQETFFKLLVKKPRYTVGKGCFKTWLFTIGKNTVINYIKHNKQFEELPLESMEFCDQVSFLKDYLLEEQKIVVHRALHKINADYRQVLLLVYFENFPVRDAAVILRKSPRQTTNLLYQAKLSLKSELEKEGFDYENL